METLMTVDEVAHMLGLKKSTVYSWTHSGYIPHIKVSRNCVRFRQRDIMNWLEKKAVKGRTTFRVKF